MKKLIIILLLIPYSLYATNYYVKNGGLDAANGLTDGTAWETIAKVNASSFSAGDTVFFNKGDVWREILTCPSSGNATDYVTFISYGTGDKPKLLGSDVITTYTAHATRANVYRGDQEIDINPDDYDAGTYHASIFFEIGTDVTWGNPYVATMDELTKNYDWFWQNDTIYFYYTGNPTTDIDAIECAQRDKAIEIGARNYLTFDGLDIRYCASRGIRCSTPPEAHQYGLNVRNCHIAYMSVRGGDVGYGFNLFHSDMIIEGNTVHDCGRRGMSFNVVNQVGTAVMDNVLIQDNIIYNGYHTTGIDIALQGNGPSFNNIVIRRNIIYDDPKEWPYDNITTFHSNMIFIENNATINDDEHDIDSVFIYANVIRNTTGSGIMLNSVSNAFVVNNTITGTSSESTDMRALLTHGNIPAGIGGNTTVLNNIFFNYCNTSTGPFNNIRGATGGYTTFDAIDYNLHYVIVNGNYLLSNTTSYTLATFAAMQAAGLEVHSPNPSHPLFIDSLYNVSLTSASPAKNAGTPIAYVEYDVLGNPYDAVNPSIGAYEYFEPDPTATDILTFVLAEQTGTATINSTAHTVGIEVLNSTVVTALEPTITVSEGATISPTSGTATDFTDPVIYTVTAQDTETTQEWTVTVTIQNPPQSPVIVTDTITDFKSTIANISGNLVSTGGDTVTDMGICWGTSENPTISGNHTHLTVALGVFTYIIRGLESNTTYYVRSFATNTAGTAYSVQESFITPKYTLLKDTKIYKVGDLIMVVE